MRNIINFNYGISNNYQHLRIIYDDVTETTNRGVLAVRIADKIGLITKAGTVIFKCIYDKDTIYIDRDIIEIIDDVNNTYKLYKITVSRDYKTFKIAKIFNAADNKNTAGYVAKLPNMVANKSDTKYLYIGSKYVPMLYNVTKQSVIVYMDGCVVIGKNGKYYNGKTYLNVVDVSFRNELLGINFITVGTYCARRVIDILNERGELRRRTTWTKEDEAIYGVTVNSLYSRNKKRLNSKGDLE